MARVIMTITCDWEGEKLVTADLQAMKVLNAQLEVLARGINKPVPITHFICPAYFTRTDVPDTRQNLAQKILDSGAIKATDEIGVHIHCWKSLALEATIEVGDILLAPVGIATRQPDNIMREGKSLGPDTGYTVPFGAYSQANAKLYLDKSIELLKQYFPAYFTQGGPHSYRSGMWVTCDVIYDALRTTGLSLEASGLPYNYVGTTVLEFFTSINVTAPMLGWLAKIWGAAQVSGSDPAYVQNSQSFAQYGTGILGLTDGTQISQPKKITGIMEIPDTGALLPITNMNYMNLHINKAFSLAKSTDSTVFLSIGFHQEDCHAAAYFETDNYPLTQDETDEGRLEAILGAVGRATALSELQEVELDFLTITQAGAVLGV